MLKKIRRIFLGGSSYVSKEGLMNLKYYKYGATDKSFISRYILCHYWNAAVHLFPIWMAPNLITFLGLCFMIFALAAVIVYIPDLESQAPSWVYYLFAFCMWMYSTFDNVDGKQARRTHSSSPLGHLFDHGCDALNCSIGGVVQAAAMGLGQSVYSLIIPFVAFIPFYLSTWEEYHTGIMYLGYINGPTEGLMIACLTMIFSGYFGPHIWKLPLKDSIFEYYTPSPLQSYLVIDLLVFNMFLLLFLIHVPVCLKNIHESFKEKKRDAYKLLMELLPLLVFTASSFIWVLSDNSYVLRNHIILFILTIGLVFGRMTTKIILSHVTKMPFPFVTVQLLPLIIGAILMNPPSWSNPLSKEHEEKYLYAYFVFVFIAYFHWAWLVISRFCAHLNINCFTLNKTKKL
ncbi:sn-1,2-diacylglycerol cholinephosphotransferas-like protein [Rozella allomycis CSF55]|uniref:sn-1,2-diacylglycerol cholinephosphotransferas-like protein n=1 Tax=Rozella allomycis (strain CSF55) TaxID=988480 RepID=A0A4P9YQA7_ROZAC|nr:sn-1,2-diacylglycerol cholinephosphotransferas-like protein [Rozella allomycis CSF55]